MSRNSSAIAEAVFACSLSVPSSTLMIAFLSSSFHHSLVLINVAISISSLFFGIYIIPYFYVFVKRFLKISAKIFKRLCYLSLPYCSRESLWLSLRSCDHFCNRPSLLTYILYHIYREKSIGNNVQSFAPIFVQSARP